MGIGDTTVNEMDKDTCWHGADILAGETHKIKKIFKVLKLGWSEKATPRR